MMRIEENGKKVEKPINNTIIGDISAFTDSVLHFEGTGNVFVVEGKAKGNRCNIAFKGDNAVVYLSENKKHNYFLKIDVWRESAVYFGENSYFNGIVTLIASERQSVIVGRECVFSFGIYIRTADAHLIYDVETKSRTNPSRGVVIGDHVWIGQGTLILKGSYIGSGSVVAANAVVAGKKLISNAVYAGNPVKLKRKDIFFLGSSVQNYKKEDTRKSMKAESGKYIYNEPKSGEKFLQKEFEEMSESCTSGIEKYHKIRDFVVGKGKNRFYQANSSNTRRQRGRILRKLRRKLRNMLMKD